MGGRFYRNALNATEVSSSTLISLTFTLLLSLNQQRKKYQSWCPLYAGLQSLHDHSNDNGLKVLSLRIEAYTKLSGGHLMKSLLIKYLDHVFIGSHNYI